MAEINANIVVEPINLAVVQDTTNLGVTVDSTSLNLYTTVAVAAGGVGEIQYNNNGQIAGIPITTFDGNNLTLGDVSNVKLNGGNNTFFLQTDGTGNLTWAAGTVTANTGNGIASGANTQIQMTDGTGNFTSGPGFTFNNVSNLLSVPGNVYIAGSIPEANIALANVDTLTVNNTFNLGTGTERISLSNVANGNINFDVLDNSIIFQTVDSTGNINLNIRGNSTTTFANTLSSGNSMTISYITKNSAVAYAISSITIDGNVETLLWSGDTGNGFPGTINGRDLNTINIFNDSGNYTILATRIGFV
jgi:hypothetical protein